MKTALVTGANTGIGFETARALASSGFASVLACRNLQKAQTACEKIRAEFPTAKVEAVVLDLADLESVRSFGKKARESGKPLDVLCNNAGVMACPESRTADGFEMQLGVNHLGHFLLTSLLLPLMMDPARPARIVNLSSSAHQFGSMDFEDLQYERRSYSRWGAYGQSKLANLLFTYELARRLPPHVTANAVHPGVVATELFRHFIESNPPWWKVPLLLPLYPAKLFLKTPKQGAATSIHVCTSPELEGVTGKYFADSKEAKSTKASHDPEAAKKLWDESLRLTKAEEFLPQRQASAAKA